MFELTLIWIVLVVVVIVLAIARKIVSRGEDDVIHLRDSEAGLVPKQALVSRLLDRIDRWEKTLTIFMLIYGAVLLAGFLYRAWEQGKHLPR